MQENKEIAELMLPEIKERKTLLVYLKIVFTPVLIYALAWLSYLHYIDFKINLTELVFMGLILLVALLFARHNAEYASNIFEQQKNDFKQNLKRYIMKNFLTLGKETKCNASFDSFAHAYVKNIRNENLAQISASSFAMMGILGTFVSIALSLPDFKIDNLNALEQEISSLLSGIGTAFYISIYGIFLSLWWGFFEKFGNAKIATLIDRQKNATSAFFWTKEELEQRYLSQGMKHFEKIELIFEQVSHEEFFKELDNSIQRKFGLFQEMLSVEERAIKVSSEHIKQTMSELTRAHRNQKDLGKIYMEMTNSIEILSQNFKELNARMSEQYNRLLDISQEKTTHLDKSINALDARVDSLKRGFEHYQNALLENQEKIFNGFKTALIQGMHEFKEVYQEERSIDDNMQMLGKLKDEISELDDETSKLMEKISQESQSNERKE